MYSEPISHLPDPDRQAAFYDGVTIKRGIAWVLDTVIITILVTLVSFFLTITLVGIVFIPIAIFVLSFIYRWSTIAGGSATWGMRTMSIELRDAYGHKLNSQQALFHTIGYTVSFMIFPLQIISILMMLLTERGQGLTDHVMGTVALNKRA